MRALQIAALVLQAPSLFGAYQYYLTYTSGTPNPAQWDVDQYGVMISKVAPPDGSSNYEVDSSFSLVNNGNFGGVIHYLRAVKSPAVWDPSPSYYKGSHLEVNASGRWSGGCGGTVTVYKQDSNTSFPPVRTQLASAAVGCGSTNTVRSIVWTNTSNQIVLAVFFNNVLAVQVTITSGPVGWSGLGGESMAYPIQIGPKDKIAPTPVNGTTIGTSVYPTEADAQWQATTDDTNGIGLWQYQIYRNGTYWGARTSTSFSDTGLSPGTIYTYTIYAEDWHFNLSAGTSFSVTTPSYGPNPAVVTPPARTGVHSVGSYWGAAGEQIDMLSGNLNFTLPLFKAMGRGAWGQTFALNYNSQLWRLDSGGTWNLGRDVGYGWGWRLMAGSIAPYWSDAYTIQYYLFTDSTGAEYKLDINTNGIWTSSQAAYLTYDGANQLLYFPDGSFWKMACYSAGTEPDAGTRYPTIMQDTNGNQVLIRYQTGAGAPWSNSSARITEVEDVRAVLDGSTGRYRSWAFTYDGTLHLTGITNYIGTAESYTFAYLTNQSLSSPFQPPVSYPTTTLLQSVTNAAQLTHTFEFAGGSGEMSKVTFPYGGIMRWAYRSFTYGGGKTDREVQYRYLTMSSGGTEYTYTLTRDDADNPNNPVNGYTCVADPSGIGQNCWFFNTTSSSWMMGLNTSMEQRPAAGQTATQRKDITWVQDAALSPYIGTVLTTLDPSGANLQTKTTQVLDIHGNVTQTAIYDYGNLTTPARTYTNTYLTSTNYTSIGIWNRLQSSTVTNGSQNVTLVTNTYDGNSLTSVSVVREYVGVGTYRGNLTSSAVPGATTNIFYDITGAVVSRNDGQGHTLAVTQSSATNFAAPDVITVNGDSHSNQNMTYTPWLATSTVTGPNSASASVTYDSKARPATSTSVDGAVTTYGYSASGVVPYVVTATTNSHWSQTTLDGFGRTAKSVRGTGSTTISEVDTVYGPCACSPIGKTTQVSQPYVPGNTVYWTKYTYDGLGRTVSVLSPDAASTTTYAYSGNTTTITDAAGKWKKQTTDAMGNLKQVNEPNPAGGADYVTSYTYDVLSHLTQVSMPRPSGTQTRTFVYDPTTQRLSSETHPESGAKSYTYNADGTVATRTDARGVITHYTYDSFQRVTLIQDGTACEQVTIAYDQGTNGWGRPYTYTWGGATCVGSLTFIYKYGYTPAGRVTTKGLAANRSNGNLTLTAGYTYDNEGHLTSIAYPDSTTGLPSTVPLTYSLDAMGRPTALSSTNNGVVTYVVQNAQYGPSDELVQSTYPPGGGYSYTETRHYNSRLQLTEMQTPWSDYQYVYSTNQNNGRILQAIGNGETVSYTYDTLNRMATASSTGGWGQNFTYDGFGNLTDKTPTAGSPPALHITVNATTNRINGDSYDANGNVTSSPQGGGAYDGENRLVTSMSEKYSYGPDNLRVYKQHPDGSEELYFNGLRGEKLQVYNTASPLSPWGGGGANPYFAGRLVDGNYRDRLGSVQWFWRYGGPPPTYTGYYPYGEEHTTTTQDREKFATYFRDATTGLDYARNRYYSSILGRFMSADPYMATASGAINPADPVSWNRYAYAGNDPVNFSDPSGLIYGCPSGDWAACGGGTDPGTGTSPFDPTLWNFVTHFSPSPETPKPPKVIQAQKNAAKKEYDATRNDTLKVVKNALSDSDCRGLFGSGADPYAVLSDVLQGSGKYANFREVYWPPDSDGNMTYGEVIKVPMFKASFRLNLIGWASNVDNGNTNQNAETLLHELGHLFSAVGYGSSIKQDIFGSKNSQYNDWLIDKDCFGGKLGYAKP